MLKKTILATLTGTALLASNAVIADNGHRRYEPRHVVVVKRPVVQHYHYVRPAPRVVVVQRPAPVYYQSADAGAGLAILAGAVIGGAIAYHIANGN
jgi:uncharacterized protein YcfJ